MNIRGGSGITFLFSFSLVFAFLFAEYLNNSTLALASLLLHKGLATDDKRMRMLQVAKRTKALIVP